MGYTTVILGIALFCGLLAYMFFKLGDQSQTSPDGKRTSHFVLQLIMLVFLLSGVVLLGKATLDSQNHCDWLETNSTISASVSHYEYAWTCEENTANTANTFYYIVMGWVSIVFLYLVTYFVYSVLVFLGWVVPKE